MLMALETQIDVRCADLKIRHLHPIERRRQVRARKSHALRYPINV
jgi:hypothetical protein